jgi:hypothetical protein
MHVSILPQFACHQDVVYSVVADDTTKENSVVDRL